MQEIVIGELLSRLNNLKSKDDRILIVKRLFEHFSKNKQLGKLNKFFSQILLEEKETFAKNIDSHFVTWNLWDIYFSFLSLENIDQILSKEAIAMLEVARDLFLPFLDTINDQLITVGKLERIGKNIDYFSNLISNFLQLDCISEDGYKETLTELDKCLKMLKRFSEQMDMLRTLYRFIEKFDKINYENISKFLPLTFDGHEIRMLCSSGEKLHLYN
ncbi:hypothetical protein LOD99_11467 [Oopsacas minuta]|uniref:Uncharacterized protein n=1 Tax=Oopsacas minuta TaxID=111878 RepID=A0AAV7JYA5_9METZ|nr:hypothetical protein LOD99_11467 [Oopsacas minuta]